jgi:hypothetical protein
MQPKFKKDEDTDFRELDNYQEGDIVTLCTCFSQGKRTKHPTDTIDGETCQYCGYFIMESRISEREAELFNSDFYRERLVRNKVKAAKFAAKERIHDVKLH